ncbi:MAG: DUF4185 domain-containing protein [Acholeplasmatales bacterium]|nr:MAG: DUF4185 domain-containing protein [Acholeplasmatales bacterium]
MKRFVVFCLFLFMAWLTVACETEATIPIVTDTELLDIEGLSVSRARLDIGGLYRIQEVRVPTNSHLPGTIISYEESFAPGTMIPLQSEVTVLVADPPEGAYSLSPMVAYVHDLGYLTGPQSLNHPLLVSVGIRGTDLGIPVRFHDEMVILYGDSVPASGFRPSVGNWFSNFVARTRDTRYHEGLLFDAVTTNEDGVVQPFAQGAHDANVADDQSDNPHREVTKIPTGGLAIGNDFYIFYMSVRYWGFPGQWFVTYNQVLKSSDDLQTFTPVEGLRFYEDEAPNFGQIFVVEDPDDNDRVYLFGKPGGRSGGTVLARTLKSHFEDRSQIDYYLGNNVWLKGDAGLAALTANPHYVIQPPCSEMSVMYNAYLGKWMAVYLRNSQIVMQTAEQVTGPFTNTQTITNTDHYTGLYGGFVHETFTRFNGQVFYLQLSLWHPDYQVKWIEVVLK